MLTYGSGCSGIEAASVAWEPLGWEAKFFAEIEPFPAAVLHHHYSSGRPRFMPSPDEDGISAKERKQRIANVKAVVDLPDRANGVPNYGDFTRIPADAGPVDVLVAGTPCQSFSVAGKRLGLDDPRGNLALEYVRLAKRLGARILVWENVPGVFSSAGGRNFADFLGFLTGRSISIPRGGWRNAGIVAGTSSSYGLAWRVLDAQYVRVDGYPRAVPQRRRRVVVIGYLGDWRRAAAILFEPEGMQGHSAPRRKAGQGIAAPITAGSPGGSGYRNDADTSENLIAADVSATLPAGGNSSGGNRQPGTSAETAGTMLVAYGGGKNCDETEVGTAVAAHPGRYDLDTETFVAHSLRGEGFDASEDGTGRGTPLVAFDWYASQSQSMPIGDQSPPLKTSMQPAVAFSAMPMNSGKDFTVRETDVAQPVMAAGPMLGDQGGDFVMHRRQIVRRLMPHECARLQGFADDRCRIPWKGRPAEKCPDGPQYKAYGNSMAIPFMRWIGMRIDLVERLVREGKIP